jgi:hypothetical protein
MVACGQGCRSSEGSSWVPFCKIGPGVPGQGPPGPSYSQQGSIGPIGCQVLYLPITPASEHLGKAGTVSASILQMGKETPSFNHSLQCHKLNPGLWDLSFPALHH